MRQLGMGSPKIVRSKVRLADGFPVFLDQVEDALRCHLALDRLLGSAYRYKHPLARLDLLARRFEPFVDELLHGPRELDGTDTAPCCAVLSFH